MEFFDKKEEVIDIQLTQYGKYLLSNGKFNPTFYAFYDDDVIYDTKYASSGSGYGEDNTQIQTRILDVPRPKAQYVFTGRESKVSGSINKVVDNPNPFGLMTDRKQNTEEKHYALGNPIGTTTTRSDNNPAWEINILRGEIKEIQTKHTGSLRTSKIPQLEIEIPWKTTIQEYDYETYTSEGGGDVDYGSVYSDLTFVDVDEDYLLVEVKEKNAPYSNENFDIEVYSIDDKNGIEKLTPLFFRKGKEYIQNDLLLSENEAANPPSEYNSDYVNYFLEIFVDDQVDPSNIKFLKENILIDRTPRPDFVRGKVDIYDNEPNDEECPD